MQKVELYINLKKYFFTKFKIAFLKFYIFKKGIIANLVKIAIIINWLVLKDLKELQTFLKFANFYYRFIIKYLRIVSLITNFFKKG